MDADRAWKVSRPASGPPGRRAASTLRISAVTRKLTSAATATPAMMPRWEPRGVSSMYAMIEPGLGPATSPTPNSMNVAMPDADPAIMPRIVIGFISTYGK